MKYDNLIGEMRMPTAQTSSEKLGKAEMRWQRNKDGSFSGVVIRGGKSSEVLSEPDENRLISRLRNKAGELEPNYIGMEGAKKRFLEYMPGGFAGERNLSMERDYKLAAHKALTETLTGDSALEATDQDAAKVRQSAVWINLLSFYEAIHLKEALAGPNGAAFLRSAGKFAAGDYAAGAREMEVAMKPHGRLSWPTATYFPYLWDPDHHMFLKPAVTCDFAERIGHPFQYMYDPDISGETYEALLDLAAQTMEAIQPLGAQDLIDVQSFIWVVGAYREKDLPNESQ